MANANIAAVLQMGASTTELVSDTAATITGSPDSVAMSDGLGNGHRFDATGEQAHAQHNDTSNSPTEACLKCTFEPLANFSGLSDGRYFLAKDYNNSSAANFIDLSIVVASGAVALEARVSSTGSGGTEINTLTLTLGTGKDFLAGVVYSVFTAIFRDPDTPGAISHIAGINGDTYISTTGLDATDYAPVTLKRLVVGNAGTNQNSPAQAIIRDVVFHNDGHWQPRDLTSLCTGRFDTDAVTDSTIYQPTYTATGYSAASGSYRVRCYIPELGALFAVHNTNTDEYHVSTDEGDSWGSGVENPGGNGVVVKALWAQPQGYPYMYLSSANGKVYRATKSLTPSWSLWQEMSANDRFVVPGWGHSVYGPHVIWGEYLAASTANKLYHSPDGGDTIFERDTLPTGGGGDRYHEHALEYDQLTGRCWRATGDTADILGYSDDHWATGTAIAGNLTPSVNLLAQGVGIVPRNGVFDDVYFAMDTGPQAGLLIRYRESLDDDPSPFDNDGEWNPKLSMTCLVASPYADTCFMVGRLENGTLLAWNTSELGGTAALWAGTPDGMAWDRLADVAVNDGYDIIITPNYAHFSTLRMGKNIVVNGETQATRFASSLSYPHVPAAPVGLGTGLGI